MKTSLSAVAANGRSPWEPGQGWLQERLRNSGAMALPKARAGAHRKEQAAGLAGGGAGPGLAGEECLHRRLGMVGCALEVANGNNLEHRAEGEFTGWEKFYNST